MSETETFPGSKTETNWQEIVSNEVHVEEFGENVKTNKLVLWRGSEIQYLPIFFYQCLIIMSDIIF